MPDSISLMFPRAFAYIVDALAIYFIMMFIPPSSYIHSEFATRFAVGALYFTLTEAAMAGSIGKKLVGLKVVDDYGDSAGIFRLLIRNILKMASISYYFFSYATVLFFGRALHDIIAHTDVDEDYYDDDDDYDYDDDD